MVRLGLSVIVAGWIGAIALIAAQNGTAVSLKFLVFQSVPLPLGLVFALCAMVGMVGMAIAVFVWNQL